MNSRGASLLLLALGALWLLSEQTAKQRADAIVRDARRDLEPLRTPPRLS